MKFELHYKTQEKPLGENQTLNDEMDFFTIDGKRYELVSVPFGTGTIKAVEAFLIEKAWTASGSDPLDLANLIKNYPAAIYLSWVTKEMQDWIICQDREKLDLLGNYRDVKSLDKAFIDFLIYEAVREESRKNPHLQWKGPGGVLEIVSTWSFVGKTFSVETINNRYYDFTNPKTATFLDLEGDQVICGPTKIVPEGVNVRGFWRHHRKFIEKTNR